MLLARRESFDEWNLAKSVVIYDFIGALSLIGSTIIHGVAYLDGKVILNAPVQIALVGNQASFLQLRSLTAQLIFSEA